MRFFLIREISGFLFPNNLDHKLRQVNEMWKIHVRYDPNYSPCLIYNKRVQKERNVHQ